MVIDTLAACAELVGVPLGGPPAAAPAGFPATIPEDFEVGRAGNRQTTAAHVLEIAAIQAVLEPDTTPGAMVPLYYDKLTGTPGVMDRVNAWRTAQGHGGRFRSGNVNGIMRGVFRRKDPALISTSRFIPNPHLDLPRVDRPGIAVSTSAIVLYPPPTTRSWTRPPTGWLTRSRSLRPPSLDPRSVEVSSTQKNFCTRADCRRVCTKANCGAHYYPGSRTRFTVIEGVCFI